MTPARAHDAATRAPAGSPVAASAPATPAVVVDDVSKRFGSGASSVHALDHVSLDVATGEFVCLIGASGCGKSTLLNLMAGLDHPSAGTVDVRGRCSLMFQESALFGWLTVAGNVELALKLRGVRRAERRARARELLDVVHLGAFADKRPHELSGGMRQRVALARAFAQDADVLLMDEPFGALDAMTRDLLHDELESLWQQRGLTVVFVTHNVREAARLADRVVLLSSRPGRVAATFTPGLPRPRRMEDPATGAAAGEITARLRKEVARHAG
ncbi:MAG: transporter, ATPase subunit [Acidimicrobiales bacterium]|nr:transporter, ATPase subunit [Acidimicrobiales bacterium]